MTIDGSTEKSVEQRDTSFNASKAYNSVFSKCNASLS